MYINVFLSRLPLFRLSFSSSSLQIYLVSFRPSTLDSTSPSRSPPLFISPPLSRSLSLFSPRSFLTLRTRTCTYTQCSLRHRDHSSRFHPLGRLPFNPLLLPLASPRFHRVSAPSTTYSPPRAFLLAVSFRLPQSPSLFSPLCLFRIHAICIRVTSTRAISALRGRLSHHLLSSR